MKKVLPILIILVLSLGCQPPEEQEFEPEPNVFALMRVGADFQLIKVERTASMADTVGDWGITDAQVKVRNDYWGEVEFLHVLDHHIPNLPWRQWTSGEYVTTGRVLRDRYLQTLEVILPWGDTVTAEAYMPSPIHILVPTDSDTVSISRQSTEPTFITWNKCDNTEIYLIYCTPDEALEEYPLLLYIPAITADTSYALFLERMIFPWVTDKHYKLTVEAVSPQYYDYLGFGPQGSISNLSSGYGVFGGVAVDSIRIYIAE